MASKYDANIPTSAAEKDGISRHHVDDVESERQSPQTMSDDGMNFATDEGHLPPGYYTSSYFLGTMLAIGLGLLAGTSGFKFAGPVLTVINAEIGPDPNYIWIALVYTLCSAVTLLIIGRVSDIFGRRYVFIGGAICGTIGSIVCATAQNIPTFIGGMVLIGIAAATQLSYYYVMGELVPMKYRILGNGFCYIFAVPSAFGPVYSRAFIQDHPSVGWRGPYYVLIAINALALACWVIFYHPPTFEMKHQGASKKEYMKHFDYVGTTLYTGGALIFLMGLNWGGSVHPWRSSYVIATIVVGFLSLVGFVLWQGFMKLKEPLMPLHIFRNRGWLLATIVSGLGASMFYAFAVVWPRMVAELYTQPGQLISSAVLASLQALAITLGEILSGALGRPIGFIKWQITGAFAIAGVLFAATATATPDTRIRAVCLVFFGNLFVGWAEGLAISSVTLTVHNQEELGTASGAAGSIRFLISSIAQTVYNVVLTNRLAAERAAKIPVALTGAGLPSGSVSSFIGQLATKNFTSVDGITPAITAAGLRANQEANASAFSTVFLTTIAFTALAVLCAAFLPDIDKLLSDKVAVTLGKEKQADLEKEKVAA